MKTRIIIILLSVLTMKASAQTVTFFSPEFEWGVKQHLGLSENDEVLQSQTDTITSIDLSGLGIIDVSAHGEGTGLEPQWHHQHFPADGAGLPAAA